MIRALPGLTALPEELAGNSGTDGPFQRLVKFLVQKVEGFDSIPVSLSISGCQHPGGLWLLLYSMTDTAATKQTLVEQQPPFTWVMMMRMATGKWIRMYFNLMDWIFLMKLCCELTNDNDIKDNAVWKSKGGG